MLHLPDFAVDEEAIPQALIEVPLETWEAVEEAEFEEVADAEVGEGMKVVRKFSGKQKPRPNKRSRLASVVVSNLPYTSGA